jgi:hypothetical protein
LDAAALNRVLDHTQAEYLILIEDGSSLAPEATSAIASALVRFPETDLLYGDDQDPSGRSRLMRPIFSPLRLRVQDYLGGVRVARTAMVKKIGGFRDATNGAHAYDLALRLSAAGATAMNSASVLGVSSLAAEPETVRNPAGSGPSGLNLAVHLSAVRDQLESLQIDAEVVTDERGTVRLRYEVADNPLVSLIIPTRGSSATVDGVERVLVVEALRGITERSTYDNLEFVVVADNDTPQSVIDDLILLGGDRLRLVRWAEPFNFSAKINRGAVHAAGTYLVPLNDDVELISPDWIETMLGIAQQREVGLVGATLLFEDGTIQHAGHLYRDGSAGHVAVGWEDGWNDRLGSLSVDREVSGVTAACAMVSADTYWSVGGFSTLLPGNYNDVDFCMKIRALGKSVICTPFARLRHFESKSRVATIAPSELSVVTGRWGSRMQIDPYWPESD